MGFSCVNAAEILKHEHLSLWATDARYLDLIEFNGHTYVLYQNYAKSDILIHDPGCVCNNVR